MNLQLGARLPGGPIRSWQLVVVFLPFLLPLLHPLRFLIFANLTVSMGMSLYTTLVLVFLGLLVLVSYTGWIREFQLWALPAQGLVLFFASALLQLFAQMAVYLTYLLPVYGGWPNGLFEKIWVMALAQLVYLEFMVAAVVGLLWIFPGFLEQVRQEWTLLSFLLYGIAILPVVGNDEFQGVGGYEIAGLLVLAVGCGLYLLVPRRWQRVLVLVAAAILSPAVMSLGLYQTFPAQSWAVPSDLSFRLWEALQPLLYLFPLPILLLLAALAPRL
ncbi:MAG: hypothetical protein ACM3PY_18930, partial [Omnitrophica WOR_2 bacterium]